MFTVCDVDIVRSLKAELSGLWRAMLRLLFVEGDSNFASGLALPRRSGFRLFKASMRFVVQDELAHKHMLGNKGAAGSICCSKCTNVMNIDPARVRHRTDVHHYGLALPKDFSLHTDASAWAVVDHIGAQRLVLHAQRLAKGGAWPNSHAHFAQTHWRSDFLRSNGGADRWGRHFRVADLMFAAVRIIQHVDAAERFATMFVRILSALHVLFFEIFHSA